MKNHNAYRKNISGAIFLLAALTFFIFPYQASNATSVIADSPCDKTYYESLAARAWLEAQREITQNQNIILKPDSVLEYTCFDRLVYELGDHASNMLSESSDFGSSLGTGSLGDALEDLVGGSISSYLDSNFYGHDDGLLSNHPAGNSVTYEADNVNGGSSYDCDNMGRIWQAAKCINFITEDGNDGFFTFAEYADASDDKRKYPTACSDIQSNWQNNLNAALTAGPWTNDPVKTYLDKTAAQDCSGPGCECDGQPIPTGLKVYRAGTAPVSPFDEHVCLQPGCRYDKDDDKCVGD